MSLRARHEAHWTHDDALVKGRRQGNRGWVLLIAFALVFGLATTAYLTLMRFETVSYQLRTCTEPLTKDSTWVEVRRADCEPVDASGAELELFEESDRRSPDRIEGSTYFFDEVPVNWPVPGISLRTTDPMRSIVLAEPTTQTIRRELSSDASDTRWSANVGSRGPVEYWILVTP